MSSATRAALEAAIEQADSFESRVEHLRTSVSELRGEKEKQRGQIAQQQKTIETLKRALDAAVGPTQADQLTTDDNGAQPMAMSNRPEKPEKEDEYPF